MAQLSSLPPLEDSLAPFQGVITNPCPLGMDIEFQKGAVEKGRKEEKMMIARRSLEQGLEVQVVAAITGLSVNEVNQLQGSKQKNKNN
ncbi:MAG: hypothetical protein D3909_15885 [Candidatus Electrothrix sp. ATG1]|nr:hypothetical protein [Candidatus Electrothrix sp. ATG1]